MGGDNLGNQDELKILRGKLGQLGESFLGFCCFLALFFVLVGEI